MSAMLCSEEVFFEGREQVSTFGPYGDATLRWGRYTSPHARVVYYSCAAPRRERANPPRGGGAKLKDL
jgi:hypothetical protein